MTLRNADLPPLHVCYVDLLAAMDTCVLKTGYGIVSEVIVNRVVAIYSDRYLVCLACVCMYDYHIAVSIKTLASFGVCVCVCV